MKVAFLTLGCKVNAYETEKMKEKFIHAGYDIVAFSQEADIYVVNTCTVTNIADRKSRQMLHRARRQNPEALVVAAGCYVDSAGQRGECDDSVDVFLSNQDKADIVERLTQLLADRSEAGEQDCRSGCMGHISEEAAGEEHTRAYIQIQNGCNQFCSYCIIPYVRGELTSRNDSEILEEVRGLASQGIHEIVLTGIHLSSFGVERCGDGNQTDGSEAGGARQDKIDADSFVRQQGRPLLALIQKLSKVQGIERIRLSSLEPRIITREFVKGLSEIPEFCPHFHLSLQSGCDETLRRMNRHYTTEEYREGVMLLRTFFDHPAITTDIIVGFPGEDEEEFQATCDFAREIGFARIHVFKYSRRQGTVADKMDGQVPEQVKSARSQILLETEAALEAKYQEYFFGKEEKVLLEEVSQIGDRKYLTGYNERYVRIAVPAEDRDAGQLCSQVVTVSVSGNLADGILRAEWMSLDRE